MILFRTKTRRWALLTVLLTGCLILASVATGSRTEDMLSATSPAIETVTGIPFAKSADAIIITEPLSHLRLPTARAGVGRKLTMDISLEPVAADVVEIGVRRGDFWLDYERLPLFNRTLEELTSDESGWRVLRGTRETVFIHPRTQSTARSVTEFLRNPPTNGVTGLFGNTTLAQSDARTAPFRIGDDPDTFAAIYAAYVPFGSTRAVFSRTITMPLTTAFQHPDGAFDIMLFTNTWSSTPPLVRVTEFRGAITPQWLRLQDIQMRTARAVRRALFRSPSNP